jgi:flagellar assembly factor FliW
LTLQTKDFGLLTIEESSVVAFPEGLPGFEGCRRFALLEHPNSAGLVFLQGVDEPGLCFITVPVACLWPDYRIALSAEDRELLRIEESRPIGKDTLALAILSFAAGEEPTANLLAPVVIHLPSCCGIQAVRADGTYQVREPIPAPEAVCS